MLIMVTMFHWVAVNHKEVDTTTICPNTLCSWPVIDSKWINPRGFGDLKNNTHVPVLTKTLNVIIKLKLIRAWRVSLSPHFLFFNLSNRDANHQIIASKITLFLQFGFHCQSTVENCVAQLIINTHWYLSLSTCYLLSLIKFGTENRGPIIFAYEYEYRSERHDSWRWWWCKQVRQRKKRE